MQYTIEIERWKREVCVIDVESVTPDDAEEQALTLYLGEYLENQFDDYGTDKDIKNEAIRVLDNNGDQVKENNITSNRNVFV